MSWTASDIPDQTGRVAVVTGANSGVGYESAKALAAAGAHVVMAVRDPDRGAAARDAIQAAVPGATLELSALDLASLASVRDFAARTTADHDRLDILMNNAGVMATPEQRTADGFELQLGTALFGHFTLTARLWPLVTATPGARVVTVTSFVRLNAPHLDPADPLLRDYDPWRAYGRSKLATAVFGLELHRRLQARQRVGRGPAVASLIAHPGFSNTNLQASTALANSDSTARSSAWLVGKVGMSAQAGARSQLRAATDPRATSGQLYAPAFVSFGPATARRIDALTARRSAGAVLWQLSQQQSGETFEV